MKHLYLQRVLNLEGGKLTGLINFNNTVTLATNYTGCRISLRNDRTNW